MLRHSNNDSKEMMELCDYYPKYYWGNLNNFEEDYYDDPSEFIPRIKGTELLLGITFMNFNYIPILTSRVVENKRKYYLFDVIKIWTSKDI